jgi:hypothetical protein
LRPSAVDPAPGTPGVAPMLAAPWHLPAAGRRRRQAEAPGVQALSHRLLSLRGPAVHIDIAALPTVEGKPCLFVGIDRTSQSAVTPLIDKADRKAAREFLQPMPETVPCRGAIGSRPRASGIKVAGQPRTRNTLCSGPMRFDMTCEGGTLSAPGARTRVGRDRAPPGKARPSPELGGSDSSPGDCCPGNRSGRADEPHDQGR